MTENRTAEAGEQLPVVIGEPVLPETFPQEEIQTIREACNKIRNILGSEEFKARLRDAVKKLGSAYPIEEGGDDHRRSS